MGDEQIPQYLAEFLSQGDWIGVPGEIVCIPNSDFVMVQPSRHFLNNPELYQYNQLTRSWDEVNPNSQRNPLTVETLMVDRALQERRLAALQQIYPSNTLAQHNGTAQKINPSSTVAQRSAFVQGINPAGNPVQQSAIVQRNNQSITHVQRNAVQMINPNSTLPPSFNTVQQINPSSCLEQLSSIGQWNNQSSSLPLRSITVQQNISTVQQNIPTVQQNFSTVQPSISNVQEFRSDRELADNLCSSGNYPESLETNKETLHTDDDDGDSLESQMDKRTEEARKEAGGSKTDTEQELHEQMKHQVQRGTSHPEEIIRKTIMKVRAEREVEETTSKDVMEKIRSERRSKEEDSSVDSSKKTRSDASKEEDNSSDDPMEGNIFNTISEEAETRLEDPMKNTRSTERKEEENKSEDLIEKTRSEKREEEENTSEDSIEILRPSSRGEKEKNMSEDSMEKMRPSIRGEKEKNRSKDSMEKIRSTKRKEDEENSSDDSMQKIRPIMKSENRRKKERNVNLLPSTRAVVILEKLSSVTIEKLNPEDIIKETIRKITSGRSNEPGKDATNLESKYFASNLESENDKSNLEHENDTSNLEPEKEKSNLKPEKETSSLEYENELSDLEHENNASANDPQERSTQETENENDISTLESEKFQSTYESKRPNSSLEPEIDLSNLEHGNEASNIEPQEKSNLKTESEKSNLEPEKIKSPQEPVQDISHQEPKPKLKKLRTRKMMNKKCRNRKYSQNQESRRARDNNSDSSSVESNLESSMENDLPNCTDSSESSFEERRHCDLRSRKRNFRGKSVSILAGRSSNSPAFSISGGMINSFPYRKNLSVIRTRSVTPTQPKSPGTSRSLGQLNTFFTNNSMNKSGSSGAGISPLDLRRKSFYSNGFSSGTSQTDRSSFEQTVSQMICTLQPIDPTSQTSSNVSQSPVASGAPIIPRLLRSDVSIDKVPKSEDDSPLLRELLSRPIEEDMLSLFGTRNWSGLALRHTSESGSAEGHSSRFINRFQTAPHDSIKTAEIMTRELLPNSCPNPSSSRESRVIREGVNWPSSYSRPLCSSSSGRSTFYQGALGPSTVPSAYSEYLRNLSRETTLTAQRSGVENLNNATQHVSASNNQLNIRPNQYTAHELQYPRTVTGHPNTKPQYLRISTGHPNAESQYPRPATRHPNVEPQYSRISTGHPNTESQYPRPATGHPNTEPQYPRTATGHPNTEPQYPRTATGHPNIEPQYPRIAARYSNTGPQYPSSTAGYSNSQYQSTAVGYPYSGPLYSTATAIYPNNRPQYPEVAAGTGYPYAGPQFSRMVGYPNTRPQYPATTTGNQRTGSQYPTTTACFQNLCGLRHQITGPHTRLIQSDTISTGGQRASCSNHSFRPSENKFPAPQYPPVASQGGSGESQRSSTGSPASDDQLPSSSTPCGKTYSGSSGSYSSPE
ncbi:GATA zinc finger domain-containing protein 7 isoform X4 [Eurytemora carolleeae]|uniref:GATA zinc finger domain-containing protein 7 isoform X4 n=1 Tax=Eurytemora carolleeae TaxID=1294199 RepID=UPI000C789F6B|nr:GATA zinc finger domain-containing protein 7 isoform X4 [Eurytemora carolleeae]|eukprot:XP_023348294.1 GATA zinc finger domain-containing protein 7-like isoform X4 [Eurytemora affinis]